MDKDVVQRRRAIEALRAGVPNRDVVRQLKPVQVDMEERFNDLLESAKDGWSDAKQQPGLLIEGDFGTGKSHWLEYYRHLALEHNFVCSSVVLSKETPLYDLNKLYRSCVESAVVPDKLGPALEEIGHTYKLTDSEFQRELFQWVEKTPEIDPRFAATFFLFERSQDEELRARIIAEWTGYPMRVPDLRAALREIGEGATYKIRRPQKGQALQRFQFLSRFFRSAGYAGWVILVDETEMISKYSLRQRGKSYAHLAQLMGLVTGISIPGLATVFTLTKDYTGQVLRGRKNDIVNVSARMDGTRDEAYVLPAEVGMRTIEGRGYKPLDLRPLTPEQVMDTYATVRGLHSLAYNWQAPEIDDHREYSMSTSMRQYIRSWITVWDLRRLYGYDANVIADTITPTYDEDVDLQQETPEEDDEPVIMM